MEDKEAFLEKLNRMSLYVRRAWDHTMPLDWSIPPWYIYDYEIFYVKRGELRITVGSVEYEAKPGDVFFFTPYVVHSIRSVGKECVRQPHIHFDFYYDEYSRDLPIPITMPEDDRRYPREDVSKDPLFCIPTKTSFTNPAVIENLILNLIAEKNSAKLYSVFKVKSLLFEILSVLVDKSDNVDVDDIQERTNMLKAAVDFIYASCDRNVTTGKIAGEIGYSKNYFSTIFKQYYGISPIQYHRKVRIQKAKNLLSTTQLSVTAISVELGFDSVSNFCRYFKQSTDLYPEEYRKK